METSRPSAPGGTAEAPTPGRRRVPVATAAVLLVTGVVTTSQFVHPEVLDTLRRDPDALASGEWWRTFTPLLVQSPAWQALVTVPGIALLGVPVERLLGSRAMLALYLAPAAVGEALGYLWQPHGAGNSIADLGLAGGLVAWLFLAAGERGWPRPLLNRVRIWGGAVLAGAVVDTAFRDIHGLPTLTGAALGAGLLLLRRRRSRRDTTAV
ncbi:rhomboid family intramembrane serine protease [Streptomyces kanamyceticus]|uniref:rhomboid family intramembrane serine protease n=1 Tax=Streptomyces kanamyceticus TaxID=1967 RepID=UPI0037DDDEE2